MFYRGYNLSHTYQNLILLRLLSMKNTLISILYIICVVSLPISAKSVYVYDKAKILGRSGPSDSYRGVINFLPGTKLEIIGENVETQYTQVRDQKEREYWIKTEYLTPTPTSNILLAQALKRIEKSTQAHQEKVQELSRKIKTMEPLEKINQNLQSKISAMDIEMEQLKLANSALKGGFDRDMYFAGGITIIIGIILGWIFSSRSGKRESSWS